MDELEQRLQGCIQKHLSVAANEEFDMSVELLLLGLDSMGAISLLLDVEEAFLIRFPRGMIDPKIFHTGEALLAAVRQLKEAQPGPFTA